jgi:Transcription factor zinc-finger
MELQCPGCQKKLAIADQHAGQMIKCPSCGGMFMAPALPAVPALPPVVQAMPVPSASSTTSEAPGTIPFAPAPPPPPVHPDIVAPPIAPPIARKPPMMEMDEPPADIPPGDFSRTRIAKLCPDTVCWLAPVGCAVIFLLSFGKWLGHSNLWELLGAGDTAIIFYAIFTIFLGLPLAWAKLAFEKGWIPKQDFLRPIWAWRSLIVAGVLGAGFLILGILWLMGNLGFGGTPPIVEGIPAFPAIPMLMDLSLKLAVRVHLIAVLGALAEFWLERRKKLKLPLPEATIRW